MLIICYTVYILHYCAQNGTRPLRTRNVLLIFDFSFFKILFYDSLSTLVYVCMFPSKYQVEYPMI